MCASPEYLEAHGIPQSPEALTQHRIILARGLNPVSEIRFQRDGTTQTIKLQAILSVSLSVSVSDNDSAASAALAGLGITRLLNYQIAGSLKNGQLKILLSEFEVAPVPVHIVHREGRHSSAKIRSFVDLMAERLRGDLSLN